MLVPRSSPASQEPLAQRFTTWRAGRRRGERIQEELWQAAAECARRDGLSATAVRLKLSYYDLKRRLEAGGTARRSGSRGPDQTGLAGVLSPETAGVRGTDFRDD